MILAKKEDNIFTPKEMKSDFGINSEELLKNGLHFGHRVSRCHPKMKPYLYGVRNTVHIINLEKTAESLEKALAFIKELAAEGKTLMLVGTKVQARTLLKEIAEELDLPYVVERWLGGTFTNFDIIKKRVEHFKDLEDKRKGKDFDKYTKKEKAKIDKELRDLETKFGGLRDLDKIPDAVFILDMKKDKLAVNEARAKGVKVVAIADTNIDPTLADYPIYANDDALSSIRYIVGKISEVIKKNKKG